MSEENPTVPHVMLETTAGEARSGASNVAVAEQVEKNVDTAHKAAEHAATVAKVKGPDLTGESPSAAERLKAEASNITTNAAVEGQKDVESAKATSASYLEQAKALASNALSAVQSYLPTSLGRQSMSSDISPHTKPGSNESATDSVTSSLQSGVSSTVDTAKRYVGAAQETMQSQVEKAKGAAQGLMGTAGTQGAQLTQEKPLDVSAAGAPLESGPHTMENTTYPSGTETTVAGNEPDRQ